MQLWLVRHAVAVEAVDSPGPDGERQLTARGRKKFRAFVDELARLVAPPQSVLTSPLVRAVQTAQLLAKEFGIPKKKIVERESLGPGCTVKAVLELAAAAAVDKVAVVGHQPDLAICLAELIGGGSVAFGKGSIAAVELPQWEAGAGRLLWLVGPELE